MIPVVSNELMRLSDAETILQGTSGRTLMMRAGEALYRALPDRPDYLIAVGTGNNGGDGYQVALRLHEAEKNVKILRTGPPKTDLSESFAKECGKRGISIETYSGGKIGASVILDCIFGTGFSKEAEGNAKSLIEA
ncbi:MAG: hypothetical protein IK088_05195, partial [Lachnospiraceae bacterium]|nr:hypothetical protein [Lachnospiraceae bacterium]